MPISEKFLDTDSLAYVVSRRLDERIKEYIHKRSNNLKTNGSLKDILINCTDVIEITNGFEHPPKEILEELTEEGKATLFDYYKIQKEELLNKYCGNMILGFDAIRIGYELCRIVLTFEGKADKVDEISKELSDFGGLHAEVLDQKVKTKNYLLNNPHLTPKERQFLYQEFDKEMQKKVVEQLTQSFLTRVITKIYNNLKQFCSDEAISTKVNFMSMEKKLKLCSRIYKVIDHYKKAALTFFHNDAFPIIKKLEEDQANLEKIYKAKALNDDAIQSVRVFLEKADARIASITKEYDLDILEQKLKTEYEGYLKKDVDNYISEEIRKIINNNSTTQKIKNKFSF